MSYVPLYIKTNNSLLSSMIKLDDLKNLAISNNLSALTITDNNMYGVLDFYYMCIDNNIKPIVGLEIVVDNKKLVLYCKNYVGYQNLCNICTIMTEEPLSIDDLVSFKDDLILIVPISSMNLYNDLNSIFNDIFIGYANNKELQGLTYDNLVFMRETLYLHASDRDYFPYLIKIKTGTMVDKSSNCLVSYKEFVNNYGDYLDNNNKIYAMCNLKLPKLHSLLPVIDDSPDFDSYHYLRKLCIEGLKKIFGATVGSVYIDRLKYELSVIKKMGFCDYFLVVFDYVKFAKDNGILVGPGRGSAAGSLVAYCLNITTIDPLKYNLMFERFLNPYRVSMPDIDIDFADGRRDEVIKYCIAKYGVKRVAPIITFGTMKSRQAIRDVAKIFDIDQQMVDNFCKLLDPLLSLQANMKNLKIKNYLNFNKSLAKCYDIALHFEGVKRHSSVHAAGIVMSNNNLNDIIPLVKHGDIYLTGFDMNYLERLGLLKMDFLGLKNLTLIANMLEDIDENLTFDNILFDKSVFSIFTLGNTLGIFQFESAGMIKFLKRLAPSCFEDIVACNALFRPGPINNIDAYVRRKKGLEQVSYFSSCLVDVLKPTYGIIIYQEQIMQIANIMAGYSLGEADILRRAMSKKKEDILVLQKEKFIDGCVLNGFSRSLATEVFTNILKFAAYGFNRAHAVAYSLIAYRMAYLKFYYPKVFFKHILSSVLGSSINTKKYIYDARLNDIKIFNPDINLSTDKYLIVAGEIIFPFVGIKNVSKNIVESILAERKKGMFKNIFDFVKRVLVDRKVLECLILAGCFDCFHLTRRTLFLNLELIINYSEIGTYLSDEMVPILEKYAEYDNSVLMAKEFSVLGFYLNNHPVTKYRIKYDALPIIEIDNYFDQMVSVVVLVERIKTVVTKKNETMCFVTGVDEVGSLDIVLFPKVYAKFMNIKVNDIILFKGRVEKRFDNFQLVINNAFVL
ncbi:MAG: DNA polymerase III subunit alpha, partial [Bacilli bacterium]